FIAEPAVQDGLIGVDAAVSQERPVSARVFAPGGIAFDDEDFLFVSGGFGNHLTEGIGHKGISPEFQSRIALFGFAFESDAIHNGCVNSVRNGMPPLHGPPRIELRGAALRLFVWVPSDTSRVKNHLSATVFSFATCASLSVVGPGTASARLNSSGSSVRQKYSPRNSSWREMICAPRAAASRIFPIARARFSSAGAVHFICTRPMVNLS